MLFLAKGMVEKSLYMDDLNEPEKWEVVRLVEADTEEQARDLFERYYKQMTNEYSVYYSVDCYYVVPTITKDMIHSN